MSALVTKIQEVPDQEDWEALWQRLRRFTHKYYHWLPAKVRGIDLDDLVQGAIADVIAGGRYRPPDVELVTFLCQVVRSKASHILEKERRVVSIEEVSPTHLRIPCGSPYTDDLEDARRQAAYQQLCNKLRELVNDDELVSKIVETWLSRPELKPREMAKELGISIEKLRNAQRRLSSRASTLREEWRNV